MRKNIYIYLALLLSVMTACEDNITDFNIDPKRPEVVPASVLFTNAEKNLGDRVQGISGATIFRVWSQHWTQSTYVDEANYQILGRDPGAVYWTALYTNVLQDLKSAKDIINADQVLPAQTKANQLAIIEIIEAYTFHMLVDFNGDVPYTDANKLETILFPKYDDAKSIYEDLIRRLKDAQATLAAGGSSFGSADIYYNGNVEKWRKFANTLLLRIGMRLADVDNALASSTVKEAIANGVFTSREDDAIIHYDQSAPNTHPIYALFELNNRREDYVAGETSIELLTALQDPRINDYFEDNFIPYKGAPIGAANAWANFTHINPAISKDPTFSGAILQYFEAAFFMAEAVERGFISGSAKEYYNKAIEASILEWNGTQEEVDTYLANPLVAYETAPGDWRQKIGTQKWIALYNQGFEAWTEYRRLDYPEMKLSAITNKPVPTRMIYPLNERAVNGQNYEAAAAKIGGDDLYTKLFWDVN